MKDAKAIIDNLRKQSTFADAVLNLSLAETQLLVDKSDSLYYRPGLKSPFTDAEYDIVRTHLRNLNPEDHRLTRVGPPYNASEMSSKVKHSIPMGSLDNTDDGILGYVPWVESTREKLVGKLGTPEIDIFASLKVDGSSICATYKGGNLVRVASRGNGEYGEDVTANGANFQGIPTVLPQPIDAEIRGEAILFIDDYQKIRSEELGIPFDDIPEIDRSNPRNIGNGIIGRHDGKDSERMRFLAFNLYTSESYKTEEEKFTALKELGFTPIPHKVCRTVADFMSFYNMVVDGRGKLPFEIDGIVVVLNDLALHKPFITGDSKSLLRPKYARAVKFPHKSNVTTLVGVEVTVGHTRAIVPTAKLQSVRIGGVNVDSALLNNYEEVKRLDVAIGDEVEVILAGDIIPKIVRVVKKGQNRQSIVEPTHCPVCNSPASRVCRDKIGAVTYCSNAQCVAAVFAKLDHWIGGSKRGVGILDIGDTMIKALWETKQLSDPADLYTLTSDSIKDVVLAKGGKIGKARADKIIANITAKKHLPLHTFLGSLGIELLGRRRVQLLRDAAGGQLDALTDWLDLEKLRTIQLPGFGDSIRAAVIAGIEENLPLINKLLANGVTVGEMEKPAEKFTKSADSNGSVAGKLFAGKSFCWTGTRELLMEVEQMGGTIKSGISKGLNYLVQKDPLSTSVKTAKAEALGVQIIGIDFLKEVVAGRRSL